MLRLFAFPALILLIAVVTFRRQQWSSLIVRLISFSLLILALADPVKHETEIREELTAAFDVSASIADRGRDALAAALAPYLKADRTLRLLPFGRQGADETLEISGAQSADSLSTEIGRAARGVDAGDTNIASALNQLMLQTESASILLLSDGYETSGEARQAARSAGSRGVKIFPILPNQAPFESEELSVSSLYAPLTVNAGDLAEVRVSVKNNSDEERSGMLEIWLEDQKLYANEQRVPPGEERLITAKTPPAKGGLHRLRTVLKEAGLTQGAEKPEERYRWISGKERSKLLLLSGTEDDQQVIRQLLTLKGFALESHVGDGRTSIPTMFEGYSTVILNNIARRQLPDGFLANLKDFAAGGGGVLIIGGDRSFGLGEYINTPLEEISPVKFVPPQTTKRRLNNAIVLVIDKSRSMLYENKIEAAKEAALVSIQSLKDEDFVSVVGFDSSPFVIIRLDQVSEVKPEAERRLRNLTAAGSTDLLPALSAARQMLSDAPASRKHIIVLSDGKVAEGTQRACIEEISRMQSEGVTASSVALGHDADGPFLKMISDYGRGAFYLTLDPRQLPQVFMHDIKVTTGEKTMREQSDFPVETGPGGLRTVAGLSNFPVLRGFVETSIKEGAALELLTTKGEKDFPILASWSYQRGRVVAFTSDANGRWSLPWLRWQNFPRFWSEAVESIKNRSEEQGGEVDFDLRYSVNQREILFDLAIYDPKLNEQSSPLITASVIEPGGGSRELAFRSEKKGRFAAQIEHGRPGDYKLNINYGKMKFPPLAVTISGEAFGEAQGRGLNFPLLADLAYLTGGKINPAPEELQGFSRESENFTHLFAPLLWAALLLILVEAFIRELGAVTLRAWMASRRAGAAAGETPRLKLRGSYEPRRRQAAG